MLVNKIKTHILEMKKKATVEESDIERISSLNNHKINIVKPFFERRVKLEEKNPFK
jgi:predicted nucleic acid-binding protein